MAIIDIDVMVVPVRGTTPLCQVRIVQPRWRWGDGRTWAGLEYLWPLPKKEEALVILIEDGSTPRWHIPAVSLEDLVRKHGAWGSFDRPRLN